MKNQTWFGIPALALFLALASGCGSSSTSTSTGVRVQGSVQLSGSQGLRIETGSWQGLQGSPAETGTNQQGFRILNGQPVIATLFLSDGTSYSSSVDAQTGAFQFRVPNLVGLEGMISVDQFGRKVFELLLPRYQDGSTLDTGEVGVRSTAVTQVLRSFLGARGQTGDPETFLPLLKSLPKSENVVAALRNQQGPVSSTLARFEARLRNPGFPCQLFEISAGSCQDSTFAEIQNELVRNLGQDLESFQNFVPPEEIIQIPTVIPEPTPPPTPDPFAPEDGFVLLSQRLGRASQGCARGRASADGRFVLFGHLGVDFFSDLPYQDVPDPFVGTTVLFDRETKTYQALPFSEGSDPRIDADGGTILTWNSRNIDIFDRESRQLQRVTSVPRANSRGGDRVPVEISGDGNSVAFFSFEDPSHPGTRGPDLNLYVWRRATQTFEVVNRVGQGQPGRLLDVLDVDLNFDGSKMTFTAVSPDLVPGAVGYQSYLKDFSDGSIQVVSLDSQGRMPTQTEASTTTDLGFRGPIANTVIAADGSAVAFVGRGDLFPQGVTPPLAKNGFHRNLETQTTTWISQESYLERDQVVPFRTGFELHRPTISADGSVVGLEFGGAGGRVLIWDQATGSLRNVTDLERIDNVDAFQHQLRADGREIVFISRRDFHSRDVPSEQISPLYASDMYAREIPPLASR